VNSCVLCSLTPELQRSVNATWRATSNPVNIIAFLNHAGISLSVDDVLTHYQQHITSELAPALSATPELEAPNEYTELYELYKKLKDLTLLIHSTGVEGNTANLIKLFTVTGNYLTAMAKVKQADKLTADVMVELASLLFSNIVIPMREVMLTWANRLRAGESPEMLALAIEQAANGGLRPIFEAKLQDALRTIAAKYKIPLALLKTLL